MTNFTDEQLEELKNVTPPGGLDGRVISAVRREARRQRVVYYLLEAALVAAVAASFLAGQLFLSDLSTSPAGELIRLAWTDSQSVLRVSSDWLLAVVESAPVGSLALTLGAAFMSIFLLDKIIRLSRVQIKSTRRAV